MGLSQTDKAAVVLSLLGNELASRIFADLKPSEQNKILRSLLSRWQLSDQELNEICAEFVKAVKNNPHSTAGQWSHNGHTFAGIELPRAPRIDEICESIPDWILVDHLSRQLDSVISAVLGCVEPSRAARLFRAFPADRQAPLLLSLSKERVLDSSTLDELESDLESLRSKTSSGRYGQRVGGPARVMTLIQEIDGHVREELLAKISEQDPALASFLEGHLLSVERFAQLIPAHLALLLNQLKDHDIGSVLRGERPEVQKCYLACLSKRRRDDIECLLEPGKKITQKQKTEASERLRQCAIKLKEEGKIVFPWEDRMVS